MVFGSYNIVSMLSLGLESSRSRYYQELMYEKNRLDDANRRLGEKMNVLMMEKELQQSENRYRSLVENTLFLLETVNLSALDKEKTL